ncbi:MAG: amidohydrolase family protein [Proteobacteria bacterium]|nr:amidohydrolase family protein [Pseudomonadota bacterium]
MTGLVIRNAEVEGRGGLDVRLRDGLVAEIGQRLARGERGEDEVDAQGGALIPGLIDHHIHLLATAAKADSLALEDVSGPDDLAARLAAWVSARPAGRWVRAVGWHERHAGPLDRVVLDAIAPDHPVRVQDQTGALWILNSRALAQLGDDLPAAVERDAAGRPTGRIWRGDAWLQARLGRAPPPLTPIGAALAAAGVTGLTDASVTTDAASAAVLAGAARAGDLPQALRLMSGGLLAAPPDRAFSVGPLKILFDDRDLPPLEEVTGKIALARSLGRAVAAHCVTAAELAVMLAAFDQAPGDARPGDRIEHGGVIAPEAIGELKRLGLTVVTQPAFVFERGDRYRAEVDPGEQPDLYRCASLLAAGVPVASSSDAPYGSLDPWAAMRAAVRRQTRSGAPIGPGEAVDPGRALQLYLGRFEDPGGPPRRVALGQAADLCLLKTPLAGALAELDAGAVAATIVGGRVVHAAV